MCICVCVWPCSKKSTNTVDGSVISQLSTHHIHLTLQLTRQTPWGPRCHQPTDNTIQLYRRGFKGLKTIILLCIDRTVACALPTALRGLTDKLARGSRLRNMRGLDGVGEACRVSRKGIRHQNTYSVIKIEQCPETLFLFFFSVPLWPFYSGCLINK